IAAQAFVDEATERNFTLSQPPATEAIEYVLNDQEIYQLTQLAESSGLTSVQELISSYDHNGTLPPDAALSVENLIVSHRGADISVSGTQVVNESVDQEVPNISWVAQNFPGEPLAGLFVLPFISTSVVVSVLRKYPRYVRRQARKIAARAGFKF